jgi:hypothetical protein
VVDPAGKVTAWGPTETPSGSFDGKRSYTLKFTRDISSCSWVAVPAADTSKTPPPTSGVPTDPHTVQVTFLFTLSSSFVLTLLC